MIAIADPRPPIKTLLANLEATKYRSLEYYAALKIAYDDKRISLIAFEDCIDGIENREREKGTT